MKSDYLIYLYLSYFSALSICVPLVTGVYKRGHFASDTRSLFYLIFASLMSEIISHILHRYNLYNLFVFRFYTIVQFLLLSFFFIKTLSESKMVLYIKICGLLFLTLATYDSYKNGLNSMDDLSLTAASVLLMIYSLFTFYHIMENPVHLNILSTPLFWFNTAILVYFSGCLFLFIFSNYLEDHYAKVFHIAWGVNSILNITFNLLIATGFWKARRSQIS
jgi:hypothetical protein